MHIELPTHIDEATAAAIMAAVSLVFAEHGHVEPVGRRSTWSAAGVLAGQGISGGRTALDWASADRVGRTNRWTGGSLSAFHEW